MQRAGTLLSCALVWALACTGPAYSRHEPPRSPPAPEAAPPAATVDDAALERLDDLFGTEGPLPDRGATAEARVLAFMRSRMAQPAFYASVLPALFRSARPPETGARVLVMKLTEGSDAAGRYFYRFTPCAPEDRVTVTPWWSFDGRTVSVCRDDHRPGVQVAGFNGEGEYCEGISSQFMPSIRCGCGERLIHCAPPAIARKLVQAATDEPVRTVQAIVQQHRPFSEILTSNATARSDWGNYFYARNRYFETGVFEFPEPAEEPPAASPRLRPRADVFTGGIVTTPAFRFSNDPRVLQSWIASDFLCVPFTSQSVKGSEVVKLSSSLREGDLFGLASTTGCQNCHARLENGLRAFSGWTYYYRGIRYLARKQHPGTIEFYVRDHQDLRARGPATARWFGETLSAQPEFAECVVGKVERFVYGGNPVPPVEHQQVLRRFRAQLDFAELVEQVALAWIRAGQPAPASPSERTAASVPPSAHGMGPLPADPGSAQATARLRHVLDAHCTDCHTDGATIPSFEPGAAIDRRMALRIGLMVESGRMPPEGKPLPLAARSELIASVCALTGEAACRASFFPASGQSHLVRSADEFLRAVERATSRKIDDASPASAMLRSFDGLVSDQMNPPQRNDVTRGALRLLLSFDHCANVEGSAPSAMRACIEAVLQDRLLHIPDPPPATPPERGPGHGGAP